jgi:hypothetical protein
MSTFVRLAHIFYIGTMMGARKLILLMQQVQWLRRANCSSMARGSRKGIVGPFFYASNCALVVSAWVFWIFSNKSLIADS